MNTEAAIAKQKCYYDACAAAYWDQFFGTGQFQNESTSLRPWLPEIPLLTKALETFSPSGSVLELACGPGIWTAQLIPHADHILAVDASSAMIALNQTRVQSPKVQYICADLFLWEPQGRFDVVFFAFWLSHVPPDRLDSFWRLVQRSLKHSGRFFFIDDNYYDEHLYGTPRHGVCEQRTIDGKTFDIVKVFYAGDELHDATKQAGLSLTLEESTHFVWGYGDRCQ